MKQRIRASAIVIHNDQLLAFRAIDPHDQTEYLFLPGGMVENGETAMETAERETYEETGYQINVTAASATDREYTFRWNGEEVNCITFFYRGHLKSPFQAPRPPSPDEPSYNKGFVWVPALKIRQAFSYSADILSAIEEVLSHEQPEL